VDTPKGGPFELVSYRLGALPLVNHFLNRMDLGALLLARWLPPPDGRSRLDPAVAIRHPLYVGPQPDLRSRASTTSTTYRGARGAFRR
jgi:hypothetical protein